jgi:aminoglycoside/choline kinase family phosphotransferase
VTTATTDRREAAPRLTQYLELSGLQASGAHVTSLTGDASDRRYFRIDIPGAASQVAAVYAGPIEFSSLPFAIVAALLEAMPVRTPRVLAHHDELGVVMLEDLGDTTLQARLASIDGPARDALYDEAIDIIATLQRRGADLATPTLLPYQLAFDVEKLTWELAFFVTHFIEAHRGVVLSASDRASLDAEFLAICEELSAEPRVLCHRDYHSRNLMVHDGHLAVIDFQDARMGPDTYDLASLLRDAYVDFTPAQVQQGIDRYLTAIDAAPAYRADFRRRFDLMVVQRSLKALGTFGFQATSRRNSGYLVNVPRTLANLRVTLAAHERFAPLRAHLARHLPEFQED